MSYASILQLVQDRLTGEDAQAFFAEKGITPITEVIPWENNATQFDEANYPQPRRPYVGVDFADIPLDLTHGQKGGRTIFKAKVVVDNMLQGRGKSPDREFYKKNLAYAEAIEELLDIHEGMETIGLGKPVYPNNLMITDVSVRLEVRKKRSRIPYNKTKKPLQ